MNRRTFLGITLATVALPLAHKQKDRGVPWRLHRIEGDKYLVLNKWPDGSCEIVREFTYSPDYSKQPIYFSRVSDPTDWGLTDPVSSSTSLPSP